MAAAHFLVVLAWLALALPVSARPAFQNSTQSGFSNSTQPGGVLCRTQPKDFTINQFTTFTPASHSTEHGNISFHVDDTKCSSSVILNPRVAKYCDNTDFTYFWDGKSLTVRETYTPCVTSDVFPYQVSGKIANLALYCYPVQSPYPYGSGTVCQTPTGQVTGQFMNATKVSV